MRIAIISTMAAFPWGGSEELWAQMAHLAVTESHQVLALIPKWEKRHQKVLDLENSGVQLCEWGEKFTHPEVNHANGKSEWYPYDPIVNFKPDVVCVSHGGFLDIVNGHSLLFVMLANLQIPFVTIIQANTDLYNIEEPHRALLREYLPLAKKVLFVSRENQRIGERHIAKSLANSEVINNPVNLSDHSPVAWPIFKTPHFACIARFDSWAKGHDILFEVLGSEKWRAREWQLSLYGAGEHESYLRQLVAHFQLTNHVSFRGSTNNIRAIWAEHHLLVLASRLEGTPLVLMESMLCGRPAVVTNVGGNADWVKDGETGYLARAANYDLMDEALEQAWINQSEWETLGKNARNFFLQNHEIEPGATLLKTLESCSS